MKLWEALDGTGIAYKRADGGVHSVSKANISAGYYKDFEPDDPDLRSPFNTSSYYGYDYPGADPLAEIACLAGEDGWK